MNKITELSIEDGVIFFSLNNVRFAFSSKYPKKVYLVALNRVDLDLTEQLTFDLVFYSDCTIARVYKFNGFTLKLDNNVLTVE